MFWAFSWIIIPVVGILFVAFKEWLNFKGKQLQLGESTEHLEEKVNALVEKLKTSEAEKKALLDRIQNLETIVTSQVWDTLATGDQPEAIKKLEIDAVKPQLELPEEDETAERARNLARRLRI